MKAKPQIVYIHGGMTFKSRKDYLHFLKTRPISIVKKEKWSGKYLDQSLGKKHEIIRPRMPQSDDAKYEDWKIHFERHIPLLRNNIILIGNSLGGIFLAQYLSENKFPKKLRAVFLVCAPFDGSLSDEDLVGGFKLKKDLSKLDKCTRSLTLMFSKDDPIVPVEHAKMYRKKLPNANIIIYKSKNGHFQIKKFPEIVSLIKKLK